MKCVVGVISSEGDGYNEMKNIWIENVKTFNKSSNNKVDLYFIEAEEKEKYIYSLENISDNIYIFKANCIENFENLIKKTLKFFDYVTKVYDDEYQNEKLFIIRTNLSTLFQFERLFDFLKDINKHMINLNKNSFFGGTIIKNYQQFSYSGTNLTFTLPIIKLLVENYKDVIAINHIDDIAINKYIHDNVKQVVSQNIKRIDFSDNHILVHSALLDFNNVFCYRFKTNDRIKDAEEMKKMLNNIYDKEFNILKMIIDKQVLATIQNEEYENTYCKKCFLLNF